VEVEVELTENTNKGRLATGENKGTLAEWVEVARRTPMYLLHDPSSTTEASHTCTKLMRVSKTCVVNSPFIIQTSVIKFETHLSENIEHET